jgi:hypothetical protein
MFQSRHFKADDPFGRPWTVEFRWLQTGISIRHADTVDVKFTLSGAEGDQDKVIALPHPLLKKLSADTGRALNDAWCMRLASAHLRQMIEQWSDMDKKLVTLTLPEMAEAGQRVRKLEAAIA